MAGKYDGETSGELEMLVTAVYPRRCQAGDKNLPAELSDLGLRVRHANTSVDDKGFAHDAFHVTLPAGDARPAAERAAELHVKIQMLQSSLLRAGLPRPPHPDPDPAPGPTTRTQASFRAIGVERSDPRRAQAILC